MICAYVSNLLWLIKSRLKSGCKYFSFLLTVLLIPVFSYKSIFYFFFFGSLFENIFVRGPTVYLLVLPILVTTQPHPPLSCFS